MQVIRRRLILVRRLVHRKQITINIVLQNETRRVKPVVKDLAAHDVPPDAPAILPPLMAQPVVAEDLGVEVVRLKGRVVHVRGAGPLEEEEAVVVDELVASVQAEEDGHVGAVVVVHELRGEEVEVFAVELVALGVVGHAHAEVAELVDGGGPLLEAGEGVLGAVLLFGLAIRLVLEL